MLNLIRRALRLQPRQVFEVPPLPAPATLTAEEWAATQDYATGTYPAYQLAQLAELAQLEETNA